MRNYCHTSCASFKSLRALKILLVEDNPTMQMIFQFQLLRLATTVVTVNTGQKALQAIQKTQYDMMILDVGLPDMLGDRVLSLIRAQEKCKKNNTHHLPIVMVTAHAEKERLDWYLKLGANDAFIKPVTFEQLTKICHKNRLSIKK